MAAEAKVLLGLGRHPHLLRFHGLCKDGPDQLMVTEYAALGALDRLIARLDEADDETIPFTHKHAMLNQVASGMQALAAEKLIHRDLATRNVLVFGFDASDVSKTAVKVSDFGLTVNGYTATHAYVKNEAATPIRYLAPESLQKGSYSEKSDVWAFGVLAWELLTDGNTPYYMIPEDAAVVAHVLGGGRLAQPAQHECPDEGLWEAVESCWMVPKKFRPTFAMLAVQLGQRSAVATLGPLPPSLPPAHEAVGAVDYARDHVHVSPRSPLAPPSLFAAHATPLTPPQTPPKKQTSSELPAALMDAVGGDADAAMLDGTKKEDATVADKALPPSWAGRAARSVPIEERGHTSTSTATIELRVDVTDGLSYTQDEFASLYGSLEEWHSSMPSSTRTRTRKAAGRRSARSLPSKVETGEFKCPGCPYNNNRQSKGRGLLRGRCVRCRSEGRHISASTRTLAGNHTAGSPERQNSLDTRSRWKGGTMRIDPIDGKCYTKEAFVDCYNGVVEWNAAKTVKSTTKSKTTLGGKRQGRGVLLTAHAQEGGSKKTTKKFIKGSLVKIWRGKKKMMKETGKGKALPAV